MLQEIIQIVVRRRAQHAAAREEFDRLANQGDARRSSTHRRWLVVVLCFIGTLAFVEVVLMPGKLVRDHLGAGEAKGSDDGQATASWKLRYGFMDDGERRRFDEAESKRIEAKLRADHMRLGNACRELSSAWGAIRAYSNQQLHASPSCNAKDETHETRFVDVMKEPTARFAWAHLQSFAAVVEREQADAQSLLQLVSDRFTAGSFLPEDESDLTALTEKISDTCVALKNSNSYVDHIVVLERERAALARSSSLSTVKGDISP